MAVSLDKKLDLIRKANATLKKEKISNLLAQASKIDSYSAENQQKIKSNVDSLYNQIAEAYKKKQQAVSSTSKPASKNRKKPKKEDTMMGYASMVMKRDNVSWKEALKKSKDHFASIRSKKQDEEQKALNDFKKKVGDVEFERATKYKTKKGTKGTDVERDKVRPALPSGKRIVRTKGQTTNQYGTFKNKIGKVYYEKRANRMDVNQPSKSVYPKLADGGETGQQYQRDAQASEFYWSNLKMSMKIAWIIKSGYNEQEARKMATKSYSELTNEERRKLTSNLLKPNDSHSEFVKFATKFADADEGDDVLDLKKGDIYRIIEKGHMAKGKVFQFIEFVDKYGKILLKSTTDNAQGKLAYVSDITDGGIQILKRASPKKKYAKGGEVDKKKYQFEITEYKDKNAVLHNDSTNFDYEGTKEEVIDFEYKRMQRGYCVYFDITIVANSNNEGWFYASEDLYDLIEKIENSNNDDFDDEDEYAKGGEIKGFDNLAKKVARSYKGKRVKSKYQDEYGKTYDSKEAMEVGKKVASKVYRLQLAKKKMAQGGEVDANYKIVQDTNGIYEEGFYMVVDEKNKEILDIFQFKSEAQGYLKAIKEKGEKNVDSSQFNGQINEYAKGGKTDEGKICWLQFYGDFSESLLDKIYDALEEEGIQVDVRKKWYTKGYADEFMDENRVLVRFLVSDAKNPNRLMNKILYYSKRNMNTFDFTILEKKEKGGEISEGNYDMAKNQAKELCHHANELHSVLKKEKHIEAWVISKLERATSDLSDVTHYLDGLSEQHKD